MQKIAIIIPCYNEATRLKQNLVLELISATNVTIFFANDGSQDQTITLLQQIKSQSNNIHILDYKQNQGKATTIFKAINEVQNQNVYDYIGYLDADFSTPPLEFARLIKELEQHQHSFIFGSRVKLLNANINRKWQRHIIGRVIITLINFKFKLGIYDTQCGAKIASKEIVKAAFNKPFYTSWLFDVEVFIRLQQQELLANAKEFPLNNWRDVEGSKLSWKTSFKIMRELQMLIRKY